MRSLLLAFALALGLAAPAQSAWRRPVPGAVARPFAYGPGPFRAGWHRGVDLSARLGAPVRATCAGRVATARPGLVTLRCGPWRVTHLPLATVSVRRGEVVAAGRPIGTLGASAGVGAGGGGHAGLHVGVRRAGERFGYVDPLRFFGASPPGAPPIPRAGPRRHPPPAAVPRGGRSPRPVPAPRAAPAPVGDPLRAPMPVGVRVFVPTGARALAPWPAWAGLALLLLGAAGGGVRIGVRRRRARVRAAVPSAP
jgi:hypothetical protein